MLLHRARTALSFLEHPRRLACLFVVTCLVACDADATGVVTVDAGHDVTMSVVPDADDVPDASPEEDATVDAGVDAGFDAGHDAGHDAGVDSGDSNYLITPQTGTLDVWCGPLQLHLSVQHADGTTSDVTTQSKWVSSNTAVAGVGSSTGLVTGITMGTTKITATYGGMSVSETINVVAPPVEQVTVSPMLAVIAPGATQQFTATGLISDGTMCDVSSSVAWTSSAASVATIGVKGLATGVSAGMSTITANIGMAGTATLTVN